MTSRSTSLLVALFAVASGGACGSSPIDSSTGVDSAATGGVLATGGALATGGSTVTGGSTTDDSGGRVRTVTDTDTSTGTYTRITSGTVAPGVLVGASTADCQQNVRLTNPAQSLVGFLVMPPQAFQGDPRAGDPSYAYLDAGRDAVSLPGVPVAYGSSTIDVSGATLDTCTNAESVCRNQDGYRLQVSNRLAYVITIDDWEDEIGLGRVELCMNGGTLNTQFVFAGIGGYLGGGVAHDVSIVAIVDGVPGPATAGVTIECR